MLRFVATVGIERLAYGRSRVLSQSSALILKIFLSGTYTGDNAFWNMNINKQIEYKLHKTSTTQFGVPLF
jgi:hypothetical protein